MLIYVLVYADGLVNHIEVALFRAVVNDHAVIIIAQRCGLVGEGLRQGAPLGDGAALAQRVKTRVGTMIPYTIGVNFDFQGISQSFW